MSDKRDLQPVKYINKIIKGKVSPIIKGELIEESRTSTFSKIKDLIKIFEENDKLSFKEGLDLYYGEKNRFTVNIVAE